MLPCKQYFMQMSLCMIKLLNNLLKYNIVSDHVFILVYDLDSCFCSITTMLLHCLASSSKEAIVAIDLTI